MNRNHSNLRCFIINPADTASSNKPITKQYALLLSQAIEKKIMKRYGEYYYYYYYYYLVCEAIGTAATPGLYGE
jgi:hypothetical protein